MDTYHHVPSFWLNPDDIVEVVTRIRNCALTRNLTSLKRFVNVKVDMDSGYFLVSGDNLSKDNPVPIFLNPDLRLPSTAKYAVLLNLESNEKFWGKWDRELSYFDNMSLITREYSGYQFKILSYHSDLDEVLRITGQDVHSI